MNAFALATLLSSVICVCIMVLVHQRDGKSLVNRMFILLCLGCAYWSFVEFGFCQARNFEEAWMWRKMFSGWPFPCIGLVAFSLVFTERSHYLRSSWSLLALYCPAIAFIIIDSVTTWITGPPIHMYWGWTYSIPAQNILGTVAMYWQLSCCLVSLYLVVRYYLATVNEQKRKQASLILIGISITLALVLFEWIMFQFHIRIPPVAAISIVVTCVFVGYAMWKYSLFTLTALAAAQNIVSTMADSLLLVGPEGKIISYNKAAEVLLGYGPREFEALKVGMVFPSTSARPEWLTDIGVNPEYQGKYGVDETLLMTKSGARIPVSLVGSTLPDENGAIGGVLLIARDITARRQAEAALEESEKQFRLLVGSITDVFWTMTPDLEMTYVSPSIERQRGFTASEFLAMKFEETLTRESVEKARKEVGAALASEAVSSDSEDYPMAIELEAKRKDGSTCWIESTVSFVRDPDGQLEGIAGVSRDITRRKKTQSEKDQLEEQLIQSQKMEAIGRLAGGVAHDMNNVLAAIMGSASLIAADKGVDGLIREDVDTVLAACSRGMGLTQDLLGFARKGKYVKETVSLNKVVGRVKDLLERTISKKIVIRTLLDENLNGIEGDPGQLEHALMNICINAADAMHNSGTLTIETANVHRVNLRDTMPGNLNQNVYVELKVSDTGVGIEPERLNLVFEPFFTTKRKGKGTGLGLSMVYGTIVNHGGKVDIESTPGHGTIVRAIIPALEHKADISLSENPKKDGPFPNSRGETILVVDDEVLVRDTAGRLLTKLGYTVILADGGRAAVKIYRENKDQIALVLLDMIMPDMDGTDTFKMLRKDDPQAAVLLCSGYSKNDRVNQLLKNGAVGFVQKPFSLGDLAEEISAVLG